MDGWREGGREGGLSMDYSWKVYPHRLCCKIRNLTTVLEALTVQPKWSESLRERSTSNRIIND